MCLLILIINITYIRIKKLILFIPEGAYLGEEFFAALATALGVDDGDPVGSRWIRRAAAGAVQQRLSNNNTR